MPAARSRGRVEDARPKPRSDAYVGLLGLSLLALGLAMLFAYLNWNLIAEKPKAVQMSPSGGGARPPAPVGAPVANPAAQQPAAPQQPAQPAPAPAGKPPQKK